MNKSEHIFRCFTFRTSNLTEFIVQEMKISQNVIALSNRKCCFSFAFVNTAAVLVESHKLHAHVVNFAKLFPRAAYDAVARFINHLYVGEKLNF